MTGPIASRSRINLQLFRRGAEPLDDLGAQPLHRFGGGVALRLQPGSALARLGQGAVGGAGLLGRLAQPRLADGERVFGGALLGCLFSGAAQECFALDGDRCRACGKRGDLRVQPGVPLAQDGVLRGGSVTAPLPRFRFGGERGEPLAPRLGFAGDLVERRPGLGLVSPRRHRLRPRRFEAGPRQRRVGQHGQRPLGLRRLCRNLGQLRADLVGRFVECRKAGLRRQGAARQLGLGIARLSEALFGGAKLGHRAAFRHEHLFACGPGGSGFCGCPSGSGSGNLDLTGEHREPVALAQPFCGRVRSRFQPDEPVPAPQPPVAVDDALTGFEPGLQLPSRRLALNPAGPHQLARQCGRRGNHAGERLRALGQRGRHKRGQFAPAGGDTGLALGIRRQLRRRQFAVEQRGGRCLEPFAHLQQRQHRRAVAGLRFRRCEDSFERLGLGIEPGERTIGLARQIGCLRFAILRGG